MSESRGGQGAISLRLVVLFVTCALMLLSDCMELMGPLTTYAKPVGIALMGVLCLVATARDGVLRPRLVLGLLALALLLICIPFQLGRFSVLESVALYVAVFGLACLSGGVVRNSRQLLALAWFSLLVVVVLMLIDFDNAVSQYRMYSSLGRPRLRGPFSNPNSLGNIASIIAVMFLASLQCADLAPAHRFSAVVGLAGSVVLLWLSDSRTAMGVVLGFVAVVWSLSLIRRSKEPGLRVLLLVFAVLGIWLAWTLVSDDLLADTSFGFRWETLVDIRVGDSQSLVGMGYITSRDIRQLTSVAGGATDMLYVSLYYRVGILGAIAYCTLLAAASMGAGRSRAANDMVIALIVALALQAFGESFLSSVMSYVSLLDWVLLACIPQIVRTSEAAVLPAEEVVAPEPWRARLGERRRAS